MRQIIVSKFGNEPDIFGHSLRCGMIGDWESRQLLLALSKDKNNCITYYGKAKWDNKKANELFTNNNVQFIESKSTDDASCIAQIADIDEFHIILGPHAFYNGSPNISSWSSIKTSIVTERLLQRVLPQIRLMNFSKKAKIFLYLSDRRFLLQATDLQNTNLVILAQSLQKSFYDRVSICDKDYSRLTAVQQVVQPFRFETLWFLDKTYDDFKTNYTKAFTNRQNKLIIPANQVTSNDDICNSRLDKIIEYTDYIDDYVVLGKWTNLIAIDNLVTNSCKKQLLDGLDIDDYNKELLNSKYALVLFNTKDSPDIFIDNWLTVKYWECVYHGCLTFVESTNDYNCFIPKELQVRNGEELRDKLNKCENDKSYKYTLLELQFNLVKPEYFSEQYFTNYINNLR